MARRRRMGVWGRSPHKRRGAPQASVKIAVPLSIILLFPEFKASWILGNNYLFSVQERTTVTVNDTTDRIADTVVYVE